MLTDTVDVVEINLLLLHSHSVERPWYESFPLFPIPKTPPKIHYSRSRNQTSTIAQAILSLKFVDGVLGMLGLSSIIYR